MTEVIQTRIDGGVFEVTLDRPKANAIDLATSRKMGDVFQSFRDDESLRVCILRTAGENFFRLAGILRPLQQVIRSLLIMALVVLRPARASRFEQTGDCRS
jgi:1,4-dihydroxy-2-naphthoyl-CoA synthase